MNDIRYQEFMKQCTSRHGSSSLMDNIGGHKPLVQDRDPMPPSHASVNGAMAPVWTASGRQRRHRRISETRARRPKFGTRGSGVRARGHENCNLNFTIPVIIFSYFLPPRF